MRLKMTKNAYEVKLIWDDEACVWIATSEDVPGLVLESSSYDTLLDHVKLAINELVELNNVPNQKLTY